MRHGAEAMRRWQVAVIRRRESLERLGRLVVAPALPPAGSDGAEYADEAAHGPDHDAGDRTGANRRRGVPSGECARRRRVEEQVRGLLRRGHITRGRRRRRRWRRRRRRRPPARQPRWRRGWPWGWQRRRGRWHLRRRCRRDGDGRHEGAADGGAGHAAGRLLRARQQPDLLLDASRARRQLDDGLASERLDHHRHVDEVLLYRRL